MENYQMVFYSSLKFDVVSFHIEYIANAIVRITVT